MSIRMRILTILKQEAARNVAAVFHIALYHACMGGVECVRLTCYYSDTRCHWRVYLQ